jgi:hypothetical protein
MATVPDLQMGCDTCAFIPPERKDEESPYDSDFYHYKYVSAATSAYHGFKFKIQTMVFVFIHMFVSSAAERSNMATWHCSDSITGV